MSSTSRIEWTDATWNPVTGCSKVSQGCKNCYALREWPRLSAPRPKPNVYTGRAFTDVAEHGDRLEQPLHWTKPRRIFVNSMSDLFHEQVSDRFIADVFGVMSAAHWHTFQVLTKRAERMKQLLGDPRFVDQVEECAALYSHTDVAWPVPNVHLGVSAEDQATAVDRVVLLLQTPAAVRVVSAEPLLGAIDLTALQVRHPELPAGLQRVNSIDSIDALRGEFITDLGIVYQAKAKVDQVIAGGESGPRARPAHPDWFRGLRDQCAAAGAAFFFKQWGEWWEVESDSRDEDGKHHVVDVPGIEATERFDAKTDCLIACDGSVFRTLDQLPVDTPSRHMTRLGKKAAGRLLDGRTHDEFPAWPAQ